MEYFVSYVESLNCGRNLTDDVISAYKVIYEGRGDIDALRYYSDLFNKITQVLLDDTSCIASDDGGIYFPGDRFNIPTIIFSPDVESGFDEYSHIIKIKVPGLAFDMPRTDAIKLIKERKSDCIHELIHFRDSQYKGNRRAFLKSHGVDGMSRMKELSARMKQVLDIDWDSWMVDTAYFNNQTERNAYIIQYIWKCVSRLLSEPDINISFDEFMQPMVSSDFYAYALPTARKRIIKRMYYVWDAIQKALPDLMVMDKSDIDSFLSTIGKHSDIGFSAFTEAQSEIAAGEFGFDVDCHNMISGFAEHRFNKTREISNRNVCINTFIEGDNRVKHTMSLHGNTVHIGKSNGI